MNLTEKIKDFLDAEIAFRKEMAHEESLKNQVWQITGFRGEQAEKLISLLLRWHYYDQSKDTARQLAYFGVRVSFPVEEDKQ